MKMDRSWCWLLLALALALCPSALLAHDWSNWRGPEQNGVSREQGLPEKFSVDARGPESNVVWKAPYGCRATPIVMNGRVYINNQAGAKIEEQERVMCLDAKTGKKLWEQRFGVWHTDIVSVRLGWTTLVGDPATGNVYWHGTQGLLVCFDRDGKILWQKSLTEEYGRISGYGGRLTSPVIDGNLLIMGMLNFGWGEQAKGANRFFAMNKHNGKLIWWWESKHKPRSTYASYPVVAVINGQRVLLSGGGDGYLHALKVRTGEHLWSAPVSKGEINPAPVVDGSLVYVCHGSENEASNLKGAVLCFDAGKIKDGQPELVWHRYGLEVSYATPILHDGKLYVSNDIARLHCLDARTGKDLWRKPLAYGRNARGSPVWADGKIYVGAVDGSFCIIEPGKTKGKLLDEQFFPSPDGVTDVEVNGSPAVADGRVYFATEFETYCLGKASSKTTAAAIPALPPEDKKNEPVGIRIEPTDVALQPGEKMQFYVRVLDANGRILKLQEFGTWTIPAPPQPPLPPTIKTPPPPLQGTISRTGELTVAARAVDQAGIVQYKGKYGTATARVRVEPRLPYTQDFNKLDNGYAPASWVNTQGKFFTITLKDGNKVLASNTKVSSPLVARANAYISGPQLTNYTIEADAMGGEANGNLPDIGVIANRYRLVLWGNKQDLRIDAWDAMPRVAVGTAAEMKPNVWYRLKLKVQIEGKQAKLFGKCWPRDQQEPDWQLQFTDPNPNTSGSPALYRYATGHRDDNPGTAVFFDNVRVTPNDKSAATQEVQGAKK